MSRINDYPEATSMADDDILVIDGDNGTRKVKKSKFVEIISEHVDGEIEEMRQDFQDGVDTIYNAIVAEGVTPSASTPSACAAGIATVADNEYASGKSDGKADAESVTWTQTIYVSLTFYAEPHGNYSITAEARHNEIVYDATNIKTLKCTDAYKSDGDFKISIGNSNYNITAGTTYTLGNNNAFLISFDASASATGSSIRFNAWAEFEVVYQAKKLR